MTMLRSTNLHRPKGNPPLGPWLNPAGGKRFILQALKDGEWTGQRCFIIGGGESLRGFDFNRLKGERTIAINRAFESCPFADILFSMDYRFYGWLMAGMVTKNKAEALEATRKFHAFAGLKIWLDATNNRYDRGIYFIRGINKIGANLYGFPTDLNTGIFSGNNSGYGALQLAILLKASPIYLLGYDMTGGNYHSGYQLPPNKSSVEGFAHGFTLLAEKTKARGIQIFNCNPASRLRCFPIADIDQVLAGKEGDDAKPVDEGPQSYTDETGREFRSDPGLEICR